MNSLVGSGVAVALPQRSAARQERRRPDMMDAERSSVKFRQVVVPHLADALAFAVWLTGNRSDGEDVVQEACVRALNGIHGFDDRNAKAWVLTIVRNTAFNWLAKYRPKTMISAGDMNMIDDLAQESGVAFDQAADPEVELIRKAESAAIGAAIAALPHPMREVLVLRDVNGLSYKEIATMLAVPIGTVMSRLARARGQLAAVIAEAR